MLKFCNRTLTFLIDISDDEGYENLEKKPIDVDQLPDRSRLIVVDDNYAKLKAERDRQMEELAKTNELLTKVDQERSVLKRNATKAGLIEELAAEAYKKPQWSKFGKFLETCQRIKRKRAEKEKPGSRSFDILEFVRDAEKGKNCEKIN